MRKGVLVLGLIFVAVLAAVASAGSWPVSVTPASGQEKTSFTVRFRAPDRAGKVGTVWRQYDVDVSLRADRRGCVSQTAVAVTQAGAHARLRVRLNPMDGGRWCTGTFRGAIEETETPVCSSGRLCPLFVIVKRIGRFTFRVR